MFTICKKEISLNYPKSAAFLFFPTTQRRFRTSRGQRAISVRAIEVLLYLTFPIFDVLPDVKSVHMIGQLQYREFGLR